MVYDKPPILDSCKSLAVTLLSSRQSTLTRRGAERSRNIAHDRGELRAIMSIADSGGQLGSRGRRQRKNIQVQGRDHALGSPDY